jgi:hypothetical protein
MPRPPQIPFIPLWIFRVLLPAVVVLFTVAPPSLQAQAQPEQTAPAAKTDTPAATPALTAAQSSAPANSAGEVSTHDTPVTFKVRVNLVLVRVVVRDSSGNVVPNLKKENFQLFDNRKPQVISSFNVETPESRAITVATKSALDSTAPPESQPAPATSLPQRFVALVFDDINMQGIDAVSVRRAASRLFDALAPSDRIAFYSTSGQITQEFTADHNVLREKLNAVAPECTIVRTSTSTRPT